MAKHKHQEKYLDNAVQKALDSKNSQAKKFLNQSYTEQDINGVNKALKHAQADIEIKGNAYKLGDLDSSYAESRKAVNNKITALQSRKVVIHFNQKLSQFFEDVKTLDEYDNNRGATQKLADQIRLSLNKLDKGELNKTQFVDEVAKSIEDSKPNFEPKMWHQVADLAIHLLNGLKAIVNAVVGTKFERTRTFSEDKADAKALNQVIDNLKTDIDQAEQDMKVDSNGPK